MLATRILLVVIPLAASTPGCFDPTLRPDGHEPVTHSSSTDASQGESSTATSGDDAAETTGGESTDDSTDGESTADLPIDSPCGDGQIGTDEDCDDANDRDGDGCSACTTDPGWECHDEPSVCLETCGPLPQNCLHP
jgi:cysteine-rich repeat protein